MTTFTDVFGSATTPPSEFGYSEITISANATLVWPYNSSGGTAVSKIMEVLATVGGLSLTAPDATQVSTGEDFLIRNTGGQTFTVKDNAGGTIATIAPSTAKYFYLTDNATAAGAWSVLTYGSGASSVDAAALVGYGLTAAGATINAAHPVYSSSSDIAIDATYRAKMVNFTGGNATVTLDTVVTLGDNFYFMLRNSGTGTLTVDPDVAELIDGVSSLSIQPGESLMLVTNGTAWFTVGLGRSLQYNFTQLVKDVSAAGTITLTAAEASNKLIQFIGAPAGTSNIIVPNVISIYYVLSAISTAQSISIKTASVGAATVSLAQGVKSIVICDGTNVYLAQSATASSDVTFVAGSAATPSIKFIDAPTTGLYLYDPGVTNGVGIAVGGTLVGYGGTDGLYNASSQKLAAIAYVDAQIAQYAGAAVIPAGTKTLFYANTAPTGWTKDTTAALDNTALRIVSDNSQSGGNGGVTGGTNTFNAVFGASRNTGAYTLQIADMPSHNHTASVSDPSHTHPYTVGLGGLMSPGGTGVIDRNAASTTGAAYTGISVSIGNQGGGGAHQHTINFDVRYASFIVASKNAY